MTARQFIQEALSLLVFVAGPFLVATCLVLLVFGPDLFS